MRQRFLVSLLLVLCLGIMAGSAFAVTNMFVNPGFEDGADATAPPWSFWGGTGGAVSNPFPTADNNSPRVWSNFGNPTYVNVAAQNNMNVWWLIPGATYHFHAQYYVPASEVAAGVTPRAGFYLSMATTGTYRALDPRYAPLNTGNTTLANITALDQWVTFDFDWVFPGQAGNGTGPLERLNYASYRLYGGDGVNLGNATAPNPGGYMDNCQMSSNAYTGVINGVVKSAAGPLAGASVQLSFQGFLIKTATTAADGVFNFADLIPGQDYMVSITAPTFTGVTTTVNASANMGNIVLAADPNFDPNILFNVKSSAFTGNQGDATGNWPCVNPSGAVLTAMGTPTIMTINGQKWEWNNRNENDGFVFGGMQTAPIPVNGVSIVAAVRPVRNKIGDGWNSIVDIMYSRLVLGIRNSDGKIIVKRQDSTHESATAIPNGQITVLSLVAQADNSVKVYANGTQILDVPADPARAPFTSLDPTTSAWGATGTGFWSFINVGRNNPDGWTVFNGNIGDVYVYKMAIDDVKRQSLETEMTAKYGTAPVYLINSSATAGGTINPAGDTQVPLSADQSYNITPDKYFDVTGITVDGAAVTVSSPDPQVYTFANVTASHTIAVSFTEWAMTNITGKVALASGAGVEGVTVKAVGGREPLTATTAADGTYSLRVKPGVSYTVTAFKRGYSFAPASLTAGTGDLTGKNFTATFVGAQKLVDLKVDATWANGQAINSWTNTGLLGGQFVSDGGKDTAVATASASYIGEPAVVFTNNKLLLSKDASTADASLIKAPESITGNGAYTVFAKIASTTALPWEQWYFGITGNMGGGQTADFGYGIAGGYGAVTHFDGRDMGWTNPEADGGPSINAWHYVAVTFDGAVEKVYLDGVEVNSEAKTLALAANGPLSLGARSWDNVNGWGRESAFSGAIASLELWDAALSAGEIGKKSGLVVFSGKTTLEDGVTPVAGVTITAYGTIGATTTSGADGKFSLGLPAGSYYITTSKDSYVQVSADYDSSVNGNITADTTYNFTLKLINAVTGIVKNAAGQPVGNAVVQVGANGPVAVTDAAGKYTVMGITPGAGTDFYADAIGYAAYTESIDTSAASTGAMTKNVTLTAKNELGVSVNGGFESGALDPWFLNNGDPEVGVTNVEKASGNYAGYWKATTAGYYRGYLAYKLPIIDGSTYNIYFKLKANVAGVEGQCGFDWLDAGGNSLNWWGYAGGGTSWMYTPVPNVWEQVIRYRTWNNSEQITGVRMTPPAGAKSIQIIVGMGALNIGDTMFVDDMVIDRVGPDPNVISGKVLLAGVPVKDAAVVIFKNDGTGNYVSDGETLSAADGSYSLPRFAGDYRLQAIYGNSFSSELNVTVAGADIPNQNLNLIAQSTDAVVKVKAENLPTGNLSTWANLGTAGGQFASSEAATPVVGTVAGYKAVSFNGNSRMVSDFVTPLVLTKKTNFTAYAWVYNAATPKGEETVITWAQMWGGKGAYTFWLNYGSDTGWGLVDWGDYGMGKDPIPAPGAWHLIAVSYDNLTNTAVAYVDGAVASTFTTDANIMMGGKVSIGGGYDAAGAAIAADWGSLFGGSTTGIEVYPVVKTAAEIAAVYASGPDGKTPLAKPVGVNNKSVVNDSKLVGKYVRVWGKIIAKDATSYKIDDGYGTGVVIAGTTTKAIGDMVVVDGTVQSNKSVKP